MIDSVAMIENLPDELLSGLRSEATRSSSELAELVVAAREGSLLTSPLSYRDSSSRLQRVIALCAMAHETKGDLCPFTAMVEAVSEWAALGCLDPAARRPRCVLCGDHLVSGAVALVTSDSMSAGAVCSLPVGSFYCQACDVSFGASWTREPERRVMLGLRGSYGVDGGIALA